LLFPVAIDAEQRYSFKKVDYEIAEISEYTNNVKSKLHKAVYHETYQISTKVAVRNIYVLLQKICKFFLLK